MSSFSILGIQLLTFQEAFASPGAATFSLIVNLVCVGATVAAAVGVVIVNTRIRANKITVAPQDSELNTSSIDPKWRSYQVKAVMYLQSYLSSSPPLSYNALVNFIKTRFIDFLVACSGLIQCYYKWV